MKVSVVTLSFNQGSFLERALTSVLNQSHPEIEYIVVDPGSKDCSRRIIERYAPVLDHVLLQPDRGPADGLNNGFGCASGEIFGYVNADDALLPGALEQAVREFERDPDLDVVYGHGYIVDGCGRAIRRFRSNEFDPRRFARGAVTVMQQATFFRRAAFEAVGGFNVENRGSWDAELLIDLALAGRSFRRVERFWGVFTIYPESITGSGSADAEIRSADARLFAKIVGREPRSSDRLLVVPARVGKWLRDPAHLRWRLHDLWRAPVFAWPVGSSVPQERETRAAMRRSLARATESR